MLDVKRTAVQVLFADLAQSYGCRFVGMRHEFLDTLLFKGTVPTVMVGNILDNVENMNFRAVFLGE